jgi:hypothetical protein
MDRAIPPPKPWSVDTFQQHRKHLTDFVDTRIVPLIRSDYCRRILIRAAVKSGKREIAEYTALRDKITGEPKRVHCFVSAWHRVADDEQREELRKHNLHVFSIINREEAKKCIEWIRGEISKGRSVVVHLDECDHGTGTRQILASIWRQICDNVKVTTILYSATPEEVLYSNEIDQDQDFIDMRDEFITTGIIVRYDPIYYNPSQNMRSGFCGPRAFLDAELVKDAVPFFEETSNGAFQLTSQGREICLKLQEDIRTNPNRNILVLRLSYSKLRQGRNNRKVNKSIYQFLLNINQFPELENYLVIVDKGEDFESSSQTILKERIQWSNQTYWRGKATNIPIIIVLDQTSTRSTEWCCHDRIHTVHTFRNTLQFATDSQAGERVNHYADKYGGFQPINVYGSVKTFSLSAGRISYENYMKKEWVARKIDRRQSGDSELYEIKHVDTQELHPSCRNGPINRDQKDRILQECACFQDPSLSMRVKGSVKHVAKVKSTFFPCNEETFNQVVTSDAFKNASGGDYSPRNPFPTARKDQDLFMDDLRGEYKVWQFTEIEPQRWGFNRSTHRPRIMMSYHNNILGITLRTLEGFEEQNTLSVYRSMYRNA